MNDKIRELLKNAEQSDAIARNKWRIENREQLRKERKEKLKELMINNKQQTAVEWLWEIAYNRELTVEDWKQAKERYKDEIEAASIISSAASAASANTEAFADGYRQGYNRALELSKWAISNLVPPHNEKQ